MTSAPVLLHAVAGRPQVDGCVELDAAARCWLCAAPADRGALARKWQGASFTDQNRCRCPSSLYVCEACVWVAAWNPPPGAPAPEPGKKGLNMRLFSHLYDAGAYRFANKADKAEIRVWLRAPRRGPWFAAIADSGQKHTLPWTPVNPGPGGSLFFEEHVVPLGDWALLDDVTALLDAGASKAEVASGRYDPRTLVRCYLTAHLFEERWGAARAGRWFDVVLWLAQREEKEKQNERTKEADRGAPRVAEAEDGGGGARLPRSVPRSGGEPAQALDAARRPDGGGGADELVGRRVGDGDGAGTPAPDGQLDLFARPR